MVHPNRIGAINTLIVVGERVSGDPESATLFTRRTRWRKIVGDNTDSSGLVAAVRRKTPLFLQAPNAALDIGIGEASRAALYTHTLGKTYAIHHR